MSSRVAITCLLGLFAAGCDRQSPPAEQATPTTNTGTSADEVSSDEAPPANAAPGAPAAAGKVDRGHAGLAAPAVVFADPAGKPVTLAAFRGKPVLVNLWATWCAPCIAELPTLDKLAASGGVRVLAVSQDLKPETVAPFLAQRKLAAIQPYTDREMAVSLALGANLPTTILYDAKGREVWRVTGAFEWDSPDAAKLIAEG